MANLPDPRELTTLLADWGRGDAEARDRFVGVVYGELRRMAALCLRNERPEHTLQPTALVHELYFRLFGSDPIPFNDRKHFFAIAARQMRLILVDHARAIHAEKRLGSRVRVPMEEADGAVAAAGESDVLAIDSALTQLAELDSRCAQIVELRFFAGLTEKEAAGALDISVATLKRDWEFARAWLMRTLTE
jgi:RNA polymerase sigma factor (TIGR02999 family)